MARVNGQIKRDQPFGELIYEYSRNTNIKNIVEIGTWKGMGSTKCIIDGLVERNDDYSFISVELFPEMHQKALENLKSLIYGNDKINLLNGSIIDYEESFWFNHWFDKEVMIMPEPHRTWYMADMHHLKSQKNVLDQIPESIDFLVLDGGEFTTYLEYKKLKSRTKIIALDDTNILKCHKIREELMAEKCEVIYDSDSERYGVSIFKIND